MAKDPAFLFYPGDYLRDTQCLSENVQVAYDRIMCEHMRNICISKKQLKFFTKKLSEDEIEELKMVLTEINGGYQIIWVAESIKKRREYSESRRKNRKSKPLKKQKNISKTYVPHMEIENENEIKEEKEEKEEKGLVFPFNSPEFLEQWEVWKDYKKKEFNFKYKTLQSEQASLSELANKSDNNEIKAVKIMHQSMANGWKGFFNLKDNDNGKRSDKSNLEIAESAMESDIGKHYRTK